MVDENEEREFEKERNGSRNIKAPLAGWRYLRRVPIGRIEGLRHENFLSEGGGSHDYHSQQKRDARSAQTGTVSTSQGPPCRSLWLADGPNLCPVQERASSSKRGWGSLFGESF